MNESYAVVRYGSEIAIAIIKPDKIDTMKKDQFDKMFANLVWWDGDKSIRVSGRWFEWEHRRQYLDPGIAFEPGCPLEVPGEMLNLWRGFAIVPAPGDWSLMRDHLFDVVCSGNQEHLDYLLRWMAYVVQHLDRPVGVAVALLGLPGAGKVSSGAHSDASSATTSPTSPTTSSSPGISMHTLRCRASSSWTKLCGPGTRRAKAC
jgi:hypothetical protein